MGALGTRIKPHFMNGFIQGRTISRGCLTIACEGGASVSRSRHCRFFAGSMSCPLLHGCSGHVMKAAIGGHSLCKDDGKSALPKAVLYKQIKNPYAVIFFLFLFYQYLNSILPVSSSTKPHQIPQVTWLVAMLCENS